MAETILCGYCVDLPERGPAEATDVSRCPLCKTELGVSGSGERFRIGAGTAPRRRRWSLLIAPALAGAAACLLVAAWLLVPLARPIETEKLPPPSVRIEVPQVDVEPLPAPERPRHYAVLKPYCEGATASEVRVKPAPPDSNEVRAEADHSKAKMQLPAGGKKRPAQLYSAPRGGAVVSEDVELRGQTELLAAPELALEKQPASKGAGDAKPTKKDRDQAREHIEELSREIQKKNEKKPDGFILSLKDDRPDLAGLPFLLGKACQAPATEAAQLARASLDVRSALAMSFSEPGGPHVDMRSPYSFWGLLEKRGGINHNAKGASALLPALVQILGPEDAMLRLGLIAQYREVKGANVTAALARLAIYDPEKPVRDDALHALIERPAKDYTKTLVEALRYPWAPAALRAADAIVFLQRDDLIPDLITELDKGDPVDPFETELGGKKVMAVREMVKINHHRNCLLCHPPLDPRPVNRLANVAVGPVPSPYDPLPPPSSARYYAERGGGTLARADVTYLRQDFSMMLAVEKADPWPKMQRFDFLVHTRELTADEMGKIQQEKLERGPDYLSGHRQAVLSALRRLTGVDAGLTAAAWRQAFPGPEPTWQAPPGRADCRK